MCIWWKQVILARLNQILDSPSCKTPIIGLNLANIARSIHHAILSRRMHGRSRHIDHQLNAWPPAPFFFLLSRHKISSTSVPSYGQAQIDLEQIQDKNPSAGDRDLRAHRLLPAIGKTVGSVGDYQDRISQATEEVAGLWSM